MTDGQGNPPNFDVLFAKCYQKKDKTWNGQRAKSVYNEYRNLQAISMEQIDSSTVDESSQPSKNDTNMWVETAGRVKFGRVFGMGPLAREYTFFNRASTMSASAPPPPPVNQTEFAQLKEQFDQMQNTDSKNVGGLHATTGKGFGF